MKRPGFLGQPAAGGAAPRWSFRRVAGLILKSPVSLLRFLVRLPLRLARFVRRLPRRIWQGWTRAALFVYQGRLQLMEGFRLLRLYAPPAAIFRAAYGRLHPLRFWHGWQSLRFRLRPGQWDARPGLREVRGAVRWARDYNHHLSRFRDIEALRSIVYADNTSLEDEKLTPTIGFLARRTSVKKRWGAFLHGLVRYFQAQRVLELGTGYGISGLYLAQGMIECYPMRTCMFITLEQNRVCVDKANANFRRLRLNDFVEVRRGDIEQTLPGALTDIAPPSIVFVDGPRQGEAVERFFALIEEQARPGALVVITGIHASSDMARAWRRIQQRDGIGATVDLWQWGVVILGEGPAAHLCARL